MNRSYHLGSPRASPESTPVYLGMERAEFDKALEAALRYLRPRPRSVGEVRQRLLRRGVEPQAVEEVVAWLLERGLLDDEAFASFWVENRESFRPRGRRLLAQELRQRGVSPQTLQPHLQALDEEASALRAAGKKARGLAGADYATFAAKVGGFLRRRGFPYEVVSTVTRRLWREVALDNPQANPADLPGDPPFMGRAHQRGSQKVARLSWDDLGPAEGRGYPGQDQGEDN